MPSSTTAVVTETLDEPAWRDREERHRQRTVPWVAPRQQRRARGESHPIDDFLFDYYPYSVGRLTAWHPGVGVELTGDVTRFLAHPSYRRTAKGAIVDPDRAQVRRSRLDPEYPTTGTSFGTPHSRGRSRCSTTRLRSCR